MRLCLQLLRKSLMPPGHIFRGKRRLVQPVLPKAVRHVRREYEQEEANMLLLRYPYLSEKESFGHATALGKPELYKKKHQDESRSKFKRDVRFEDRLLHLRVSEAWE